MSATRTADEPSFPLNEQANAEELDMRARKRMEVGLSPRRPTAKAVPYRPPDYPTLPFPPLALALLLVAILLLTGGLVAANLMGVMPEWLPAWSRGNVEPVSAPTYATVNPVTAADGTATQYALYLADDFNQATSALMQGRRESEWRTELMPTDSVYRMEVWPDHLAWSLVGEDALQGYRLQTSVLVDGRTPGGYAGLIARYQDERHFYLFAVDGSGRFAVQRQNGDQLETLQPWTVAPFLNGAGSANVLTVEDDGRSLRLFGNNMLLAAFDLPQNSSATGEPGAGLVGLAGGASGMDVAEMRFDWFQLYTVAPETAPAD